MLLVEYIFNSVQYLTRFQRVVGSRVFATYVKCIWYK